MKDEFKITLGPSKGETMYKPSKGERNNIFSTCEMIKAMKETKEVYALMLV